MDRSYDFLVIGGGIAGASAAYALSAHGRVAVLEQESQLGYHSTSRSAAVVSSAYGPLGWQILTTASAAFFANPPDGFAQERLVSPRGALYLATPDEADELRAQADVLSGRGVAHALITPSEASALMPVVHMDRFTLGLHEPGCVDLNAHQLLSGYSRHVRQNAAGSILTDARVTQIQRRNGMWSIETTRGRTSAPILVNAAGGWADEIASMAGLAKRGLTPLRRTAIAFQPPAGHDAQRWPMTFDAAETWYFKPEGRLIMMSPADKTPSGPCDAQADEYDVAVAVDRIENATSMKVGRIASRWAGLRTFAADEQPVIGTDPQEPSFVWYAGQGGNGVMASAAGGRLCAALALGQAVPMDLARLGLTRDMVSPARLAPV